MAARVCVSELTTVIRIDPAAHDDQALTLPAILINRPCSICREASMKIGIAMTTSTVSAAALQEQLRSSSSSFGFQLQVPCKGIA